MDRVESERARLVSLMWNFCVPQILHSIAILGIADLLADGPRTAEQLAQLSGSTRRRCTGSCGRRWRWT